MVPRLRRLLKSFSFILICALFLLFMVTVRRQNRQNLHSKKTDVLCNYREFGSNVKKDATIKTAVHKASIPTVMTFVPRKLERLSKQTQLALNRSNSNNIQNHRRETLTEPKVHRYSTEDYERYFRPKNKINPFKYDFVINGSTICKKTIPFLIILIPSIPRKIGVRNAIRNTWGSLAYGGLWPGKSIDVEVKLVFLLAISQPNNMKLSKLINEESEKYGDIVEGNFKDSYYNLTRKILIGFKWVTLFCNKARFVVKADEDSFVNLPKLVEVLKYQHVGPDGIILGHLYNVSLVQRSGKWKLDKSVYPFRYYPNYLSGCTYFISINLVSRLIQASEYFPYIFIEDAFITGILAKVVNATMVALPGVTFWADTPAKPCDFVLDNKISKLFRNITQIHDVWKEMHSKTLNCTLKHYN